MSRSRHLFGEAWPDADLERLRAEFASGGIDAAVAAFPNRTRGAVRQRLGKLGLHTLRAWTAEDDELLRRSWGAEGFANICRRTGRTRVSIYWRARKLGLTTGCPQGLEWISTAAHRCGYGTCQLRQILKWAGVRVLRSFTVNDAKKQPKHVVDPYEVDEAVRRWLETEPLAAAARRRGVSDDVMRGALDLIGAQAVEVGHLHRPCRKRYRRVRSDVADRAVRAHADLLARTMSVVEAARAYGVHKQTVRERLRGEGVRFGKERRIDRDVIARVFGEPRARRAA